MKLGIFTLACGFVAFCQIAVPAKWAGTWVLNVQESTFGPILFPGTPEGFTVASQKVRIERAEGEIRLSGDTVFTDREGSHTAHDDGALRLDGTETTMGPVSLTFKRIDDSTFQIITKVNDFSEVSEFKFSTDGKTLTETKTQTAPDKKKSTTVLVFSKT